MKKIIKRFKFVVLIMAVLLLASCSMKEQKIFNQALELQKNKKYEDAIKIYNEIIDKYPESKFVSNSNVKLNQCIDSIIKKGDNMVDKKDYFKAVGYYENALKFRSNDNGLQDKINKTKKMVTDANKPKEVKEKTFAGKSERKECKIAIDALNKYKGRKVEDFTTGSKIMQMMVDWESAWESQNIDIYRNYYDTSFVGVTGDKSMDYNQWMQYKNELFNKYTNITIASKLIDATLKGDRLIVKFEQWFNGYGPNAYSDHTYKELIFKYIENKGWLIVSEKPY